MAPRTFADADRQDRESELAKQVAFLKAENEILRRRCPKRMRLTAEKRRQIAKLGLGVGGGVDEHRLTAPKVGVFAVTGD